MTANDEIAHLEQTVEALENQRALLGDAVVETALAPLREKLAALRQQQVAEQRKVVSILFADVAGFTALSDKLDPEDVRELINHYFTRWTATIETHGGTIEKFIGDAVMAVFGLVTAREEDPENAVRAALTMRAELEELNRDFQARWGVTLLMRVGIHTGPVVVSTLGERRGQDFVVVGDHVNLASRLQSAAPENGILISHATYRHVRGVFDLQPLAPIYVKGKSGPLQVYIVLAAKPRAFREDTRGVEGIETQMIGRSAEFTQLQDALRQVLSGQGLRWLTVVAEAGLGKSRLLYEFDDWVELLPDRIAYLKGRATPNTQNQPYALLRDLVAFRFRIQEEDPPAAVQEKLVQGLAQLGDYLRDSASGTTIDLNGLTERAVWIGLLLGYDLDCTGFGAAACEPRLVRDRALLHLREYLLALTGRQAAALLLEDLHWADDSSLDALETLLPGLVDRRLLVLCAARPELYTRRPEWGQLPNLATTRLDLQPLSPSLTRRLVREILQKVPEVPESLCETISTSAEGNPFFVEEFVKMLIEDGVIQTADETWHVDLARLESMRVPQTLTEVLQARLDALAPELRLVLQRAAVIGRVFWQGAVEHLGDTPSPAVPHFKDLQGRELIFRRVPSAFLGSEEFQFKHALLRDVTYESLLRTRRRHYHARVADWLQEMAVQHHKEGEFAALIASHYDHAGQDAASTWYLRAVDFAAARFANREALHLAARALELLPESQTRRRFELLIKQENVFVLTADRSAQQAVLIQLESLAAALGPAEQAEVCLRRNLFEQQTGRLPESVTSARQAIEFARQAGDPALETRGWLAEGASYWHQAEYTAAEDHLRRGLDMARAHGLVEVEGNALRMLGVLEGTIGRYDESEADLLAALAIQRRLGNRRLESMCLNSLGVTAHERFDIPSALSYYEQSLAVRRLTGDRMGLAVMLNNLGMLSHQIGEPGRALTYLHESLEIAIETGNLEGGASAHNELANLYGFLGDFAGAESHLDEADSLNRTLEDRSGEMYALTSRAALYLALERPEAAEQAARAGLSLAEEIQAPAQVPFLMLPLGRALVARGLIEHAISALESAAINFADLAAPEYRWFARAAWAAARFPTDSESARFQAAVIWEEMQAVPGGRPQIVTTGLDSALEFYWDLHQVLRSAGDSRAAEILTAAHSLLHDLAGRIPTENLRRTFLENIPAHRAVTAAYRLLASGY